MNFFAFFTISNYLSFAIWAALFGTFYALPVSCQFSAVGDLTEIDNISDILSLNSLLLIFGTPTTPLINGWLVDYTGSYWATFFLAGSFMTAGAICLTLAKICKRS